MNTHEIENTSWLSLVFNTLCKEEKAISCLGRMCSIVVANFRLFVAKVIRKMLRLNSLFVQPKKLLSEAKAPG